MDIVAVIPARYSSSRLPGKPMKEISGKPMIQRVYQQVASCPSLKKVIVATDDRRILDCVRTFGGEAEITAPDHPSGSDRIWEVVRRIQCDGIINVQGDEPMISPDLVERVAGMLRTRPGEVITAATPNDSYRDFISPHKVKVVVDNSGRALYFSRAPVPCLSKEAFDFFHHHYGIYGYSPVLLEFFANTPPSLLEKKEKLEQLRFLEHGKPVTVVMTDEKALGVDTPEDLLRINQLMDRGGSTG